MTDSNLRFFFCFRAHKCIVCELARISSKSSLSETTKKTSSRPNPKALRLGCSRPPVLSTPLRCHHISVMDASSSEPATPILNKKRSKSAISVVIPHEPFMDNRDPLSPEEVRRLIEEKIYWTNEARAWKERAQELMSALREIAEYVPTLLQRAPTSPLQFAYKYSPLMPTLKAKAPNFSFWQRKTAERSSQPWPLGKKPALARKKVAFACRKKVILSHRKVEKGRATPQNQKKRRTLK